MYKPFNHWDPFTAWVSFIFVFFYFRPVRYSVDQLNKEINQVQKEIGLKMKAKESAEELIAQKNAFTKERDEAKQQLDAKEIERDTKIILIGNLVHDSVPRSKDEVGAYSRFP